MSLSFIIGLVQAGLLSGTYDTLPYADVAASSENHDERRAVLQQRSQERVRYLLGMQSQVSDTSASTDLGKVWKNSERIVAELSHALL